MDIYVNLYEDETTTIYHDDYHRSTNIDPTRVSTCLLRRRWIMCETSFMIKL